MKFATWLNKRTEKKQKNNTIDRRIVYKFNSKEWVLELPDSVFKQKELISYMMDYYKNDVNWESEQTLLTNISDFIKVDGKPLNYDILDLLETNNLKDAYLELLLLPLFQWGQRGKEEFHQYLMSQNL